jgi:xanthine dehydrogenase large subunit
MPVKFGISFNRPTLNQAGALVNVYTDGRVSLNHGGTEMGQGMFTKAAQVVAEVFQIDIVKMFGWMSVRNSTPVPQTRSAWQRADFSGYRDKEQPGRER